MYGVRRLMAQQITVGAGAPPCGVALIRMLTQRQGYRAVRIALLDLPHERFNTRGSKPRVLPSLQHKCSETVRIAASAAVQNFIRAEPVALRTGVALSLIHISRCDCLEG